MEQRDVSPSSCIPPLPQDIAGSLAHTTEYTSAKSQKRKIDYEDASPKKRVDIGTTSPVDGISRICFCLKCEQKVTLCIGQTCCPTCCPPKYCRGGKHYRPGRNLISMDVNTEALSLERAEMPGGNWHCRIHGMVWMLHQEICCPHNYPPMHCTRMHDGAGEMMKGTSAEN